MGLREQAMVHERCFHLSDDGKDPGRVPLSRKNMEITKIKIRPPCSPYSIYFKWNFNPLTLNPEPLSPKPQALNPEPQALYPNPPHEKPSPEPASGLFEGEVHLLL